MFCYGDGYTGGPFDWGSEYQYHPKNHNNYMLRIISLLLDHHCSLPVSATCELRSEAQKQNRAKSSDLGTTQ